MARLFGAWNVEELLMTDPLPAPDAPPCPHLRQNRWYQRGQDVGFHCLDCDEHLRESPDAPQVERFKVKRCRLGYDTSKMPVGAEVVLAADYATLEAEKQQLEDENRRLQAVATEASCQFVTEGKGCACEVNSRHEWLLGYVKERQRRGAAESSLAALREQVDRVYAMNQGPVEQVRHIPLAQFVRTRFVHVSSCNELIDKQAHALQDAKDELSTLREAVREISETLKADYVNRVVAEIYTGQESAELELLAVSKRLRALVTPQGETK